MMIKIAFLFVSIVVVAVVGFTVDDNGPYHRHISVRGGLERLEIPDSINGSVKIPRKLFDNAKARNATCNDGSPSGYYIQRSATGSKGWIIFLIGGGVCYDVDSCLWRAKNYPLYVSNKLWPSEITVAGIMGNLTTNEFRDFNKVAVMYCTSDVYSGDTFSSELGWDFHGSYIVPALLDDLKDDMASASEVLFTGGSAGGIGVFTNWPLVQQRLSHVPKLRAIPDAGWFLTSVPPYGESVVPVGEIMKKGMTLFNGVVPEECDRQLGDDAYLCLSGPVVYPFMPPPLENIFVVKSQTDSWTLDHDECTPPYNGSKKVEWMSYLAASVRATLAQDGPNAFSANCPYHESIQTMYDQITINNVTLHQAISSWYFNGTQKAYVDSCELPECNMSCFPNPDPNPNP